MSIWDIVGTVILLLELLAIPILVGWAAARDKDGPPGYGFW